MNAIIKITLLLMVIILQTSSATANKKKLEFLITQLGALTYALEGDTPEKQAERRASLAILQRAEIEFNEKDRRILMLQEEAKRICIEIELENALEQITEQLARELKIAQQKTDQRILKEQKAGKQRAAQKIIEEKTEKKKQELADLLVLVTGFDLLSLGR